MYLFIDTLSEPTYICLFDAKRNIIASHVWIGKQKEFDTLGDEIDDLLSNNTLTYSDLLGIAVIVGPGGFTGTRVTTLVANALAYSFNIPLSPLTVGEFFAYQEAPFPWIVPITKKDVLLWTHTDVPEITSLLDLPEGNYSGIAPIDFASPKHTIETRKEYDRVITSLKLSEPQKQIQPLYARDPNITIKKNHVT